MGIASLPQFPPPLPSIADGPRPERNWRLKRRTARIVVGLVWLAGFVLLLFWLRGSTDSFRRPDPPPRKPLSFDQVVQRSTRLKLFVKKVDIIALLGPESNAPFWEPEIADYDRLVDAHPDRYPGERSWAKWTDPADQTRWIAILFCSGLSYHVIKHNWHPPLT
jgi:hypothetical protein